MENFIEATLTEAVTEVGKSAIGCGLEEVETAKEPEPAIVA